MFNDMLYKVYALRNAFHTKYVICLWWETFAKKKYLCHEKLSAYSRIRTACIAVWSYSDNHYTTEHVGTLSKLNCFFFTFKQDLPDQSRLISKMA